MFVWANQSPWICGNRNVNLPCWLQITDWTKYVYSLNFIKFTCKQHWCLLFVLFTSWRSHDANIRKKLIGNINITSQGKEASEPSWAQIQFVHFYFFAPRPPLICTYTQTINKILKCVHFTKTGGCRPQTPTYTQPLNKILKCVHFSKTGGCCPQTPTYTYTPSQ
jgi:hypothetical protein